MKKQGNNYISIILMILLFGAAGLTKAYALSQYSFKSGKLYYWITSSENRTVEVVCPDGTTWWEDFAKPTGGVNIPSTVTNTVIEGGITTTTTYSVTAIGDYAFAMCSGITSVSVPATVTQIGMHAFHYCTGITSISIGNNVASIGNWAFNQCTSLSSITFPSSVTTLGNGLFADCANLSSVTFNNQPTFIPQYTFYHCGNLSTINIPGTVTVIQHEAFLGCSGLASITLNSETPPTLQGSTVFDGVDKSIPINVPCGSTLAYMAVTGWNDFTNYQEDGACLIDFTDANVKARCVASATGWDINQDGELSVAEAAAVTDLGTVFKNNSQITTFDELQYFTGLTSIGSNAFSFCTNLTSIEIPNGVTYIDSDAFSYCSGLTSITIPNSVTSIGNNAFYYCRNLTSIEISNSVTSIGSSAFSSCSSLTSITISNSVTSIGSDAFYKCSGLTSINYTGDIAQWCGISFSNSYSNPLDYGHNLYINNELVTNLIIPNSVTSIGSYAFYGCSGLTSVEIPNGVTSIGSGAFSGCSGLTSITIPNSVTSIGSSAFSGCIGLTSVYYTGDIAQWCGISFSDNSSNPLSYGHNLYINNELVTNLIIPNSVTSIGSYVFSGCSGLTSVEIPGSVTSIGSGAFSGCSGLTSITIPNNVISIGRDAFMGCSGLTSITIPNSVTSIGSDAFYGCSGLTSVYYTGDIAQWCGISFVYESSNPLYCGHNLYINNELVTNLIIPNSVTSIGRYVFSGCSGLTSVEIPNSVTSIGDGAFYKCSGLTSITIPNSVTSIGSYAFYGCSGLTSITISNGVTIIYEYAFRYCSGLTSIEIPNSVAYIGGYAFSGCNSLEEVMMLGIIPPESHIPAFDGTTCSIYVPYESVNVYKTSTYSWSTYASRIYPWLQKSIAGYGESTAKDKWVFISSPLTVNTAPTAIDNLIITETAANYDLYYFDQTGGDDGKEWKNYKAHANDFTIANGQGYLYANAEDVNLVFKGDFNENDTEEVCLIYNNGKPFAGWNLVGNPFPVAASIGNRSFYRMNDLGTEIIAAEDPNIAALEGIFVHTDTNGETVTFAKASRCNESEERIIINLSSGVSPGSTTATVIDRAIVRLGEGEMLPKFQIRDNRTKIYIPQGGKDYAIACVSAGTDGACTVSTTDVNFKTAENGTYTLSVIIEGLELGYLHLIDNLTGADVNLLASPSYTFEAKASDYASRFRLVFSSICKDVDGDNATFAFYNGSAWVIANEGQATVQVVDVTGRVLSTETINGNVEVKVNAASGVYMLRLVNGENVKVQKVVVR